MKVCLISLPSPFLIDDLNYVNLGVLYISTYLKTHGVKDVQVIDLATHKTSPLPEADTDIIGISSTTPQFPLAVEFLNTLKRHNSKYPKATYVIGGPHATCHPKSCLDAGFDIVVVGEGERAMWKIAKIGNLHQLRLMEEPFLENIDFLPDRDAIDMSRYRYDLQGKRATNVMTSRGCKFRCSFCCKTWGQTVRYVSPQLVAEEIRLLRDKYGFEGIVFFDDEMNFNLEHLSKICKLIKPLGMVWRCLLRANPLNLDLLRTMKESGCVEGQIGVESGSDKILKTIRKGTTVKDNLKAIRLIKEVGIKQKALLMIGNPGESRETVEETKQFLRKAKSIDPDLEFDLMMFTPYPLSDVWEHTEKYDIQFDKEKMDFSKAIYKQHDPLDLSTWVSLARTSHLSSEELIRLQKEIFEEFEEWGMKLARREV